MMNRLQLLFKKYLCDTFHEEDTSLTHIMVERVEAIRC